MGRALVTGASSGFGGALARELASRGWDLVLTARRTDRLDALAAELRATVKVDVVTMDLTEADAAARVLAAAGPVDLLVNAAAFGDYRAFTEITWADHRRLLDLDLCVLTELCHRFACEARAANRPARIANISSMLALYPVPDLAVYVAAKAYIRTFSEALAAELKGTGVTVTCVCLGAVDTEWYEIAGMKPRALYRPFVMSAPRAARIAARGILRGRRVVMPGVLNKLLGVTAWLMPRRVMGALTRWLFGPTRLELPQPP